MNKDKEEQSVDGADFHFHIVQPLRDLESNWAVDLAKNLEEYLLKICSGEISGEDDTHLSVNFAEAALLLQGSIQVYSRKVEYLYTLVVHALEFISQKSSQQNQPENTSVQREESGSSILPDEESDQFWGLDDIPVEAKNCLDNSTSKDAPLNFVKPPANLVVLEGDCLDSTGDTGELESYLLATNDLYQDFILLDPCDAAAVHDFLDRDKGDNGHDRSSSLNCKSAKSFRTPARRSGGTARKSSIRKKKDLNLDEARLDDQRTFDFGEHNIGPDPLDCNIGPDSPENNSHGVGTYDPSSDDLDDDDDDPWRPLNPHEPGNLKVKPFKRVKVWRRHGTKPRKSISVVAQFPLAKMNGAISSDITEIWEAQRRAGENQQESQSPPPYEKMRRSLVHGGHHTFSDFRKPFKDNEDTVSDDDGFPEFAEPDFGIPESSFMDEDITFQYNKDDGASTQIDSHEVFGQQDTNAHASLEDLCRSHLDALLASIAETEKQTEMAARVSRWKQNIEHNLEEQDSRPPFDIHEYGDRILEQLSLEEDQATDMSFADVVSGHEKHDVARTFSALLQLVNNRNVDLVRSGIGKETVCYTAVNPFYVHLLSREKKREQVQLPSSKKRAKSPIKGGRDKSRREKSSAVNLSSSGSVPSQQPNGNYPTKLVGIRLTPEGKRRRRFGIVNSIDDSAG